MKVIGEEEARNTCMTKPVSCFYKQKALKKLISSHAWIKAYKVGLCIV